MSHARPIRVAQKLIAHVKAHFEGGDFGPICARAAPDSIKTSKSSAVVRTSFIAAPTPDLLGGATKVKFSFCPDEDAEDGGALPI